MLKLGILGHPLGHTLSPILHSYFLEAVGLAGSYQAFDTPPEGLAAQCQHLRQGGYRGLNVTIPHKVAVMSFITQASPEVQALQAVNTLVIDGESIQGHNTDIVGFLQSLPGDVRAGMPDKNAVVLGVGGSARAVLFGLIRENVSKLTLVGRSAEKLAEVEALAASLCRLYDAKTQVETRLWPDFTSLHHADLVVNTTPVGMGWSQGIPVDALEHLPLSPAVLETLPLTALVYDLIYRPEATPLLQWARQHGARTQGGLEMLIHQGAASFNLWTGQPLPDAVIHGAQVLLRGALHPPSLATSEKGSVR